jgi:hypothetical protein
MTTLRLTYAELGERIGKTPEGARMLARRRRWQIVEGNDKKKRVLIDEAHLVVRPTGRPPGQPPEQPGAVNGLDQEHRERLQALRDALEQRTDSLLAMTERAARAEGEALALRDALADLAARLNRAEERLALPWWRRLF